ncbi:MAG: hypothetical protein HKN50_01335 [Gammaproteobacteria bacterium]|nr:hypothetical protein [Gammaproteobacteria bacterium]
MPALRQTGVAALAALAISASPVWADSSWDGSLELEQRLFFESDPTAGNSQGQTSARLQMEFFLDWNKGDDQLVFEPFVRLDSQDDERSHADIRQLIWTHLARDWEFSAGIGHVFWGVTESQHLVDIINQTDAVENIDGEDKLGQPMLRYQYFSKLGNIDAYLLPLFRPRTFSGPDNRLGGGLLVDTDREVYQSDDEETHLDYALRYSNTVGDWGLGFSWFKGTSRDPDLTRFFDPSTFSTTPYYAQIDQLGADIQITTDAWLIKLEAIQRNYDDPLLEDFAAATVGAEYTLVGIFDSAYDLGLLSEYSWDERDQRATSAFQNDIFLGARLALNDISDSELLFGFSNDLDDSSSRGVFVEANTRIATAWTANVELRYFAADNPRDPLFALRDHSFIQVGLEYFFD